MSDVKPLDRKPGGGPVENHRRKISQECLVKLLLQGLFLTGLLVQAACTDRRPIDTVEANPAGPGANISRTDDGRWSEVQPYDPAERVNRRIFGLNQTLDHAVVKPVATTYVTKVPATIRHALHNFTTNLDEPKIFINDVLQGNFRRASNTTGRFVLNSTVGVAGLFDVAEKLKLPHHEADFGQTFGVWGVPPGPAVQLPVLGSSNLRDSLGLAVGFVADPLSQIPGSAMTGVTIVSGAGGAVEGRAQVLDTTNALEKTSLDYYATLRSIRAQRRTALVEDGRRGRVEAGSEPAVPEAD